MGRVQGWSSCKLVCCLVVFLAALGVNTSISFAQRSLGLDVSAWQGSISQTTWNNIYNLENREFVFIRSSRGGTTGFYNQSDPNNNNGLNTLSQRYDDPYFAQNITRATSAGLLAGPYHFSRPDIVESTPNSGGIANSGTDEADHFIQMAGAWMRPGYLLPVHDFEAGSGARTANEMAQFVIDFSDRVYEVMGIRPAIYSGANYTHFVLANASSALQDEVVEKHPVLWIARWPSNPDVQNGHPGDYTSYVYGPWDDPPNPADPWSFWQYTSQGRLNSYNNGNSNLDFNVAQGGIEFLKDRLVPALWMNDLDGQWSTLTNWNSGQTPVDPVPGPGQVTPSRRYSLPEERLPAGDDTVVLRRDSSNITVTLATGAHTIRKLEVYESLLITGGSLTLSYEPVAESTSYTALIEGPVILSGGTLSGHTLEVGAGHTFSVGSTLEFNTLELDPHSSRPGKLELIDDVVLNPLNNAAAKIIAGAGSGTSGRVDLGGEVRTLNIGDGAAGIDVEVAVPILNGGLTKAGLGTLALTGTLSYTGDTAVEQGALSIAGPMLSDGADLFLNSAGLLELDFTGQDVIDSLFVDGVSMATGTWGAVGSGAEHESPLLSGNGTLFVSTFVEPIAGDFNGDGIVNATDLSRWQQDLGNGGGSDADGDGDTDAADFLVWQRNHGSSQMLSSLAVPEPATVLLALLFAPFLLLKR